MTLTAATLRAAPPEADVRSNPVGVTCSANVLALDVSWNLDSLERKCAEAVAEALHDDERFAFWSIAPTGTRAVRVRVRIVHDRKERDIRASFDLVGCKGVGSGCDKGRQTFTHVVLYSREFLDGNGLPDEERGLPRVLSKIRDELFNGVNRTALWEVLRIGAPVGSGARWIADPPPERRDLILPFVWPDSTRVYLGVLRISTRVRKEDHEQSAYIYSLSTLNTAPLAKNLTGVVGRARCVAVGGEWEDPKRYADLRSRQLGAVYVHSSSYGALPPVSAECGYLEKEAERQR